MDRNYQVNLLNSFLCRSEEVTLTPIPPAVEDQPNSSALTANVDPPHKCDDNNLQHISTDTPPDDDMRRVSTLPPLYLTAHSADDQLNGDGDSTNANVDPQQNDLQHIPAGTHPDDDTQRVLTPVYPVSHSFEDQPNGKHSLNSSHINADSQHKDLQQFSACGPQDDMQSVSNTIRHSSVSIDNPFILRSDTPHFGGLVFEGVSSLHPQDSPQNNVYSDPTHYSLLTSVPMPSRMTNPSMQPKIYGFSQSAMQSPVSHPEACPNLDSLFTSESILVRGVCFCL